MTRKRTKRGQEMDENVDQPVAGRRVFPEIPVERKTQVCDRPVKAMASIRVQMLG